MKTPFYLIVFIALSACSFNKEESNAVDDLPNIVVDNLNLEEYFGQCETDTSMYCTRIVFDIPKLTGKDTSITDRVNKTLEDYILNGYLSDSANNSYQAYSDQFITDYKTVKDKFGETFGWYSLVNGRVMRHDSTLLVIETSVKMYTGGAHGTDALYYLNFDLASGKALIFKDVFKPRFENKLNQAAHEAFKKKVDGADLEDYQFENSQFYNSNFGLLPEGIKFYYNSYEIAPYSSGATEITIPYEKVKGILKEAWFPKPML